jgi:hypothetical protein
MPAGAIGGEALCFVGEAGRAAAIRMAFKELTGRGYVCEVLIGQAVLPIDPARWEEHAEGVRRDLASRFHGAGAALPGAAEIRGLQRDGGFRLGAFFCWETEPRSLPEAFAGAGDPEPEAASSETAFDGEKPERPRRRKRRKPISDDPPPRRQHLPRILPLAFVGLMACLWGVLFGLAYNKAIHPYWFCACGVAMFLVGAVWLAWSAKADGIELPTPWEGGGPAFAAVDALMQVVSVPVIAWLHLASNFRAAWSPVLVVLMGIAMTVSGALLWRYPR